MKELLFSVTKNDFEVQHYKGSGPGGQNRNKNSTAVRIKHKDSGAVGDSQEMKSQLQNKKLAFERMYNSKEFQRWLHINSVEAMGQESIEEKVEKEMKKIKVEFFKEGKWEEE